MIGDDYDLYPRDRYITVAGFIEIVRALPADFRLYPNSVGNLAVLTADGSEQVGHVDFTRGSLRIYGDDHE